jgi:hypothetical protein
MTSRPPSLAVCKAISALGIVLIAFGISAGYIDVATHFRFEFTSDDFEVFILALLVGIVLSFVGLIGWAAQPGVRGRGLTVGLVLIAPWIAVLVGSPVGGTNIHGPAALVMLLILPSTVLASVLTMMAGVKRNAEAVTWIGRNCRCHFIGLVQWARQCLASER